MHGAASATAGGGGANYPADPAYGADPGGHTARVFGVPDGADVDNLDPYEEEYVTRFGASLTISAARQKELAMGQPNVHVDVNRMSRIADEYWTDDRLTNRQLVDERQPAGYTMLEASKEVTIMLIPVEGAQSQPRGWAGLTSDLHGIIMQTEAKLSKLLTVQGAMHRMPKLANYERVAADKAAKLKLNQDQMRQEWRAQNLKSELSHHSPWELQLVYVSAITGRSRSLIISVSESDSKVVAARARSRLVVKGEWGVRDVMLTWVLEKVLQAPRSALNLARGASYNGHPVLEKYMLGKPIDWAAVLPLEWRPVEQQEMDLQLLNRMREAGAEMRRREELNRAEEEAQEAILRHSRPTLLEERTRALLSAETARRKLMGAQDEDETDEVTLLGLAKAAAERTQDEGRLNGPTFDDQGGTLTANLSARQLAQAMADVTTVLDDEKFKLTHLTPELWNQLPARAAVVFRLEKWSKEMGRVCLNKRFKEMPVPLGEMDPLPKLVGGLWPPVLTVVTRVLDRLQEEEPKWCLHMAQPPSQRPTCVLTKKEHVTKTCACYRCALDEVSEAALLAGLAANPPTMSAWAVYEVDTNGNREPFRAPGKREHEELPARPKTPVQYLAEAELKWQAEVEALLREDELTLKAASLAEMGRSFTWARLSMKLVDESLAETLMIMKHQQTLSGEVVDRLTAKNRSLLAAQLTVLAAAEAALEEKRKALQQEKDEITQSLTEEVRTRWQATGDEDQPQQRDVPMPARVAQKTQHERYQAVPVLRFQGKRSHAKELMKIGQDLADGTLVPDRQNPDAYKGLTVRDPHRRGVNNQMPWEYINARVTRGMCEARDPASLNQGDGAHREDEKPYLQHFTEAEGLKLDRELNQKEATDISFRFCHAWNCHGVCFRRNCPWLHFCNHCRCGPARRKKTGCRNIFGTCCARRGLTKTSWRWGDRAPWMCKGAFTHTQARSKAIGGKWSYLVHPNSWHNDAWDDVCYIEDPDDGLAVPGPPA